MVSSGTYNFNPENWRLIDEAYERIGLDPKSLEYRHYDSALLSADLLLIVWENMSIKIQHRFESFTLIPSSVGQDSFTLANRNIIPVTVFHRDANGYDTPMYSISRQEYDYLNDKDQQGTRPDRYFIDREASAPVMYVWPTGDNTSFTIQMSAFVEHEDIGSLAQTPGISRRWYPAFCEGIAWMLSKKFAHGMTRELEASALSLAMQAKTADREITPVSMSLRMGNSRRRRR